MSAPTPPPGTTRTKILDAARQLFAAKGFAGTSMRDIAEELGITKAALYYHFSSKDELLDGVFTDMAECYSELVERAGTERWGPSAVLDAFLDLLMRFAPTMVSIIHDPSVARERTLHHGLKERQEALVLLLAGPRPSERRTVRARCAIGALQFGYIGLVHAQCGGKEPKSAPFAEPRPLLRRDRTELLAAALAALG